MNRETPLTSPNASPQPDDLRATLIYHVLELNETEVLDLVQARLQRNDDPLVLVEACEAGMRRVGERYEQGRKAPERPRREPRPAAHEPASRPTARSWR